MLRILTLSLTALALAPAAAHAAFAPQLSIEVKPPRADSTPSIVTSTKQAPGESASKDVVVLFPNGYTVNAQSKLVFCPDAQARTGDCPESSQIGTADATAALEGFIPLKLTGKVFVAGLQGTGYKVLIVLDGSPTGRQIFTGVADVVGGRLRNTFAGLPNILVTDLTLTLAEGDRSLVRSPRTCGTGTFELQATSHKGETAKDTFEVAINDNCPKPRLSLRPLAFRGLTARFRLSEPAAVRVRVFRGERAVGRARTVRGKAGINSVRLNRTQLRRPGLYTVRFRAVADTRFAENERDLTIKRRKRR